MTITTVAINCDVSLANNTEFTASQLEFTLSDADYDTISNDSVPAATVVLALDASGVATANLWPVDQGTRNTFYRVVLIGTRTINGRATSERFALGNIAPPSTGAPFALADLLGQSTGGIVVGSTIYETLADAVAAAVAAGAAGADPVAATAAAERAEDARDAAQLAQANAELAETGAEAARDAALLSRGVFASTAAGLSNGVAAVTVTGAGSGGANGVFALAFSGGAGTGAAGTFTVASGAVVSVTITHPGTGYTSAPTVSFAASAGVTGVTATVAIAPRNPVGTYFSVPVSGNDSLILYRVDSGPVAVEVTRYPSAALIRANPLLGDAKWNRGFTAATAVSFNPDYTWTLGNSGNYVREAELVGDQLTATRLYGRLDIASGAAATITLQQFNGASSTSAADSMTVEGGQAFLAFTRDALCNRIRFTVTTGAAQTVSFTPPVVGIGSPVRARNDRLLLVSEAWDAFSGSVEKPRRVMSALLKTTGAGAAGTLAANGLTATLPQDTTHRFDVSIGETLLTTDTVLVMVKLSQFVSQVQAGPLRITTAGTLGTLSYYRDGWWYGTFAANVSGNGADAARFSVTNSDFGGSAASVDVTVQEVRVYPRTSKLPAMLDAPDAVIEAIDNALAGSRTWSDALVRQMGAPSDGTIYLVDPYLGNDSNDGLTEATAFRTVTKLRDTLSAVSSGATVYGCIRRANYLQQTMDIQTGVGVVNVTIVLAFEDGSTIQWLDPTQSTSPLENRNNGLQLGLHPSNYIRAFGNGLRLIGFTGFTGNSCGVFGSSGDFYNVNSENCQDGFTSHSDSDMGLYGCSAKGCSKACIENVGTGNTIAKNCTFEGASGATRGIISFPASEGVTGAFTDCTFIAATADQTMDLNNGVTINGGILGLPGGNRISVISTDNAYTITAPVLSNYTEALG